MLHESGREVEEVRTQEDGKSEEVLGHSPAAAAGREGWPFANVPKLSRSIAATPGPSLYDLPLSGQLLAGSGGN